MHSKSKDLEHALRTLAEQHEDAEAIARGEKPPARNKDGTFTDDCRKMSDADFARVLKGYGVQ